MDSRWITLRTASDLTQKPERTLRYQLSQGKILGKKDGSAWQVNLGSLFRTNQISKAIDHLLKAPNPPKSNDLREGGPSAGESNNASVDGAPSQSEKENAKSSYSRRGAPKPSPLKFAAFQTLFQLRSELLQEATLTAQLQLIHLDALRALSIGFFEYTGSHKAQHYRECRASLAKLWLENELLIETQSKSSEKRAYLAKISERLIQEVIPIVSGTLKKIEKGHERKT